MVRINKVIMSKVWDKIYESDTTFFGKELTTLFLLCLMILNVQRKKVLELG